MYYLQELSRIQNGLRERKEALQDELSTLPSGHLYYYVTKDGHTYYYERLPKIGARKRNKRVGINKNPERLKELIRKEYVEKALRVISRNIISLDSFIEDFNPCDETSIMEDFIKKHPDKSSYIYASGKLNSTESYMTFSDEPADAPFSKDLKSVSTDGTKMRSLGEIAIAARLDHFGIQYKYEAALQVPDLRYVPDFTIRRSHDGKTIYWEHLGMVSDRDYLHHNRKKFDDYEEYGIVPWRNLIVTYGTEDGGINMKIVDALIQSWLL